MRLRRRLQVAPAVAALGLLPVPQRRKLGLLVAVQLLLGGIDLLAVAMVGLLGSLTVTGVQSSAASGLAARALGWIGLQGAQLQTQAASLGLTIAALFLGRTAASIVLVRRALHFLAYRSAEVSATVTARLLAQPMLFLQARRQQDLLYCATTGTNALVLGVLGTLVSLTADLSMMAALGVLLVITAPIVAFIAALLMLLLVLILHRFTTARAGALGTEAATLDIQSRETLLEALNTYRDVIVRGSQGAYARAFREVRLRASFVSAEGSFLPSISKYVLECAVIIGALLIGAAEFALNDAKTAIGALAMFLAAGTRMAPAIIRVQQGAISYRNYVGQARQTLSLLSEMSEVISDVEREAVFTTDHADFRPEIEIDDVTFTYPGSTTTAVEHLTVRAPAGSMLALAGDSGAGKSTSADLLLGVISADSGNVRISGRAPAEAVAQWPGAIAYVPQEVWLVDGSIRANLSLGYAVANVRESDMWRALQAAQLDGFVQGLPNGLDHVVGERGARLSGGQRQRLGIARALITAPRLLVLDEATSALDATTEAAVTDAIKTLRGSVTLVVIAHRLATIREADTILYFEEGQVTAQGDFEQVRAASARFDSQARLLGM